MSILLKKDILDLMTFGDIQEILRACQTFSYQGFEPEKFVVHLQDVYSTNCKVEKPGITKDVLKAQFVSDVKSTVGIYCSAGIKLKGKRIQHSTAEAVAALDVLRRRFDLQIDGPAPTDSKTVTIQRIAACFAHLVAATYDTKSADLRIPGDINKELHHALHFAMAPSIIPLEQAYEVVYQQWFVWACSFDKVINRGDHDPTLVHGFAMIQRRSAYYDLQTRINLMKKFKIDPTAYVQPAGTECGGAMQLLIDGKLKENTNTNARKGSGSSGSGGSGSPLNTASMAAPMLGKVTGK